MRRMPGEGSIHKRPNGTWCGQINLGIDRDGNRRRKTVYGRSQAAVVAKMQTLRQQLAEHGDLATSDTPLSKYLEYWLAEVADSVKPGTWRTYRTSVHYITDAIGKIRLGRLSVAHVRRLRHYIVDDKGLSVTTAHNAHRVLSIALNDALREGKVHRNVAAIEHAPAVAETDRTGLTAASAIAVLRTADGRLASRWLMALLYGMRQGECLGLRWSHVDFDAKLIDLSWSLSRVSWEHGCGEAKPSHTSRSCPQKRLKIPARYKHKRLDRNYVLFTPKTRASVRVVPMIPPVEAALRQRQAQAASETHTQEWDLVWCNPDGSPIDPKKDWAAWKDLLDAAGVPEVTLHEARNTAATLLLELGVDVKVIGAILGHSQVVTTRSYQNVSQDLSTAALSAAAALLELTQRGG